MFDVGLVLVRAPVGALLVGHGVQKLSRRLGGPVRTGEAFEAMGYRRGPAMAVLAGVTEIAAGVGLAAGAATPLAAAGAVGVMTNAAATAHRHRGLWADNGGFEYPLVVATVASGIAIHGPGAVSVDAASGLERSGLGWGGASMSMGLGGALALLAAAYRPSDTRDPDADQTVGNGVAHG
ncbi:DoxX family protein [Arthrobacter castelli]|uniref:DoxX family protein n=1 Tax=Arthrobacter castelli TaxID=271431 RepID=UPI0003FC233F|nr:DoxX family protein [Arthrobacter castelli]